MKTTLYLLTTVIMLCCVSCSSDDIEKDLIEGNEIVPFFQAQNTATETCTFDVSEIIAGSTKIVDCILDLQGNTFTLPKNVKFDYDGGDIINGTLIFTGDTGRIDGRLLNSTLTVQGKLKLKYPEFKFYPTRWNIVEGKTNKKASLDNRKNLNKTIELVQKLGGNVFEIDKIDAYFNVEANKINREYHSDRSIRIPSNFHFKMSKNTFLRVQPTHFPSYSLITTMAADNVIISGGNLIGDRWEHDYSPIVGISGIQRNTHEWGFLIFIIGTHNITVDNVTIKDAIGDGIDVHSKTIRTDGGSLVDGNRTSENVLIKNCLITECRRNNIAIIDANGVTIDNCDLNDTGKGVQAYDGSGDEIASSSGTQPKRAIDLEATRYVNDDGTIREINKVENIVIKNSRFTGNEGGDIAIYTASKVTIEENHFDKAVGSFASNNVMIRNNIFEARDPKLTYAVSVNSYIRNGKELNHHFTITGNTITGYRDGIKLSGTQHIVSNNEIFDCVTGLHIGIALSETEIFGNRYISTLDVSYGINPFPNAIVTDVHFKNEYIDVTNRPLNLRGLNKSSSGSTKLVTIDKCEFYTVSNDYPIYIEDSKNLTLKNSMMNTGLTKINSTNITTTGNTTVER